MQALGLIETRGLVPAIECADVMLKTAQVEFVERTFVGGGLVTILVTGDVGAVKAAVEAAVTAVKEIGNSLLVSHHVIPRPHQEIESMVVVKETAITDTTANVPLPSKETGAEPAKTTIDSTKSEQIMQDLLCKGVVDAFLKDFGLEKCVNALKKLSVLKLRNLAREYKELGVSGRAISKANKELLIRKLKEYYQRESEERP